MLMSNDGSMHVMSTAVHVLMFNIEWGVEDYIIMSVLQQRMILAKLSGKKFQKDPSVPNSIAQDCTCMF